MLRVSDMCSGCSKCIRKAYPDVKTYLRKSMGSTKKIYIPLYSHISNKSSTFLIC